MSTPVIYVFCVCRSSSVGFAGSEVSNIVDWRLIATVCFYPGSVNQWNKLSDYLQTGFCWSTTQCSTFSTLNVSCVSMRAWGMGNWTWWMSETSHLPTNPKLLIQTMVAILENRRQFEMCQDVIIGCLMLLGVCIIFWKIVSLIYCVTSSKSLHTVKHSYRHPVR